MSLLQMKNICKSFSGVPVLKNVQLTVEKGEVHALLGENGAGKSTLMNIIGCLDRASLGTYLFEDEDISEMNDDALSDLRLNKIGFVFQSFNLIDELNVFENVELPLTYLGIKASERKERVLEILKRMNLSHRAKHFPQQLSGGQQQRVAIARAVVTNPKLILADEPTGNLDSKNGAEVMNLLTELNKEGTSIVMVTHSQHDAGFAHRVIHLFDGSVVANIKE